MSRRAVWIAGLVVILVVVGGLLVTQFAGAASSAVTESATFVPTRTVERGSVSLDVNLTGELRPSRQQTLAAPAVGGTTLRALRMLDTGARVREGDVLVEFDPGDQVYALEQAESQLAEVQQEIRKRRADIAVQQAQDKVGLLTAQFDVRRAELDARADSDLIGANEFRIRQVTLQEARRSLEQVEQDIGARAVTSEASLQVLEERLTRAQLSATQANEAMDNLTIVAPMDGLVSVRENMDGVTVMFSGMSLPSYRVGDDVRPGRPFVDVLDVSTMEVIANVDEEQRSNVRAGQRAAIRSDASPEAEYDAEVLTVSGLGRADASQGPLRQFEVRLELTSPDEWLRPGASVSIRVSGDVLDDVLLLPRQAVFEEEGKSIVYTPAADGNSFVPRPVTVVHRTETLVVLEGIEEGTEVAIVHPASVRATISEPDDETAPAGGDR